MAHFVEASLCVVVWLIASASCSSMDYPDANLIADSEASAAAVGKRDSVAPGMYGSMGSAPAGMPNEVFLALLIEELRQTLCSPKAITELMREKQWQSNQSMKRDFAAPLLGHLAGSSSGSEAFPGSPMWRLQMQDVERRLLFCSRRNSLSKIRLF